jgi:hypothetical protein
MPADLHTNGDLTTFLSQRILNDNFEIDYDSTRSITHGAIGGRIPVPRLQLRQK